MATADPLGQLPDRRMNSAYSPKQIDKCVYCPNPPDGREHWLNRGLGTFYGNTLLSGRICTPCNVELGGTIDLELLRSGCARHTIVITCSTPS